MIEIADVFRRFAGDYLSAHGASMPPSHRRAIADILACRTEALGGRIWRCDNCSAEIFSYHSCKNRSCPKCHGPQTERWLETRKAEMLPCPYFHVTVTVPEELRDALRATFRYKQRKSNRWRACRVEGMEFMRRFLQHVLPKGLHKVRYFGLWHPTKREDAARARLMLQLDQPVQLRPAKAAETAFQPARPGAEHACPCCRLGRLRFVREISPRWAQAP